MGGIDNFYSISALGGIVMPIPVFDWGQGPIAKAQAEARIKRLERDALQAEVEAELDRSTVVVHERRRALKAFDDGVGSRTADLRRMAEDAYVTGQASILELIDAVQVRFNLQLERAMLLEEVVHAEVEVLHVTGRIEETFP
jgi:outer membrane protein TolC